MPIPVVRSLTPENASTTKVAAAQTVLINANLTLTTAAGTGVDSSGAARILLLTTTEDDSAGNAVITGTNANDEVITETIAWPNNTTKVTTKAYKTVTSINTTIAITSNVSVGTVGTTLSLVDKIIPLNFYQRIPLTVAVEITGTINFTIKETFDRVIDGTVAMKDAVMFSPTALSAKTANTVAALDVGATGVQIVVNSYSSGATIAAQLVSASNGDSE